MYRIVEGKTQNLPDVAAFVETLGASNFFEKNREIYVARAPGRLDVMGGIADYSGALVLEMPIREAALVAVQKLDSTDLKIFSAGAENNERTDYFEMRLTDFRADGKPISYAAARVRFGAEAANSWAAYVAGALLVLTREKDFAFDGGAAIYVDSKVPEGKGVSSSAAIEVAAMSAIAAAFGIEIEPRELAILCRTVENLIVGAPCGIMDQMTSAAGIENRLLALVCQPAELQTPIEIPKEISFWGIDSGIRHSVGAGDYGSVRAGAFIGYRIIADLAGLKVLETGSGTVEIEDEKWNGYLANLTVEEFEKNFAARLPADISGAEFLAKYKGMTDRVTEIAPGKNYAVRAPTRHPIYENARVRRFAELLRRETTEDVLKNLGALMFESHASYSACGLGTNETDLLVRLVKENPGELYGAKITGGGSGGTVAVLGLENSRAAIEKVAAEYEQQTGYQPYVFSGSSPGAADFGILKLM